MLTRKCESHYNYMKEKLEQTNFGRACWEKGVKEYAKDLLEEYLEYLDYEGEVPANENLFRKALLNGAQDWKQYSEGGCSLIYDGDIAERLCTPSELKRYKDGEKCPSKNGWIAVQARALGMAANQLTSIFKNSLYFV